ncbi:MAG: hypothetical protein LBQ02_01510 [Candidatus Nomurabacteria bacterium]|jgi:hypothetical protein|nr:hypothetical protein [Candidatus Nomurabacteria bacterium]
MILYLDTSGKVAKVWLDETPAEFELDRNMAKELLGKIDNFLRENHTNWRKLTGLALMRGSGSFTGLRIGASILNAVASSEHIPIVGEKMVDREKTVMDKKMAANKKTKTDENGGERWRMAAKQRLLGHQNDRVVVPFYHSEANITRQKR